MQGIRKKNSIGRLSEVALLFPAWLSFIKQFDVVSNWIQSHWATLRDRIKLDSKLSQTRGDGLNYCSLRSSIVGWVLFPGFLPLGISSLSCMWAAQRPMSRNIPETKSHRTLWQEAVSRSHFPKMVQQYLQPSLPSAESVCSWKGVYISSVYHVPE